MAYLNLMELVTKEKAWFSLIPFESHVTIQDLDRWSQKLTMGT